MQRAALFILDQSRGPAAEMTVPPGQLTEQVRYFAGNDVSGVKCAVAAANPEPEKRPQRPSKRLSPEEIAPYLCREAGLVMTAAAAGLHVGIATSARALPPLRERCHSRVVDGHLVSNAVNLPAVAAKAVAEVGLLAGNERGVKTSGALEGRRAHEGVAPARAGLADGGVPFHVAQLVVDGSLGVALAATSADNSNFGMVVEVAGGQSQPSSLKLAVAIDELDKGGSRRVLHETLEPGVAGPRRRKGGGMV